MIILDMEMPKHCFDCPLQKYEVSKDDYICRATGNIAKDYEDRDEKCPLKAMIPKNMRNVDILNMLLPEEAMISADRHGYLHIRGVKKEWLNAPWEVKNDR